NVGIAHVNRNIVASDGDPIFVTGLASRCNLDWLILRRLEIKGVSASNRKKQRKKDRYLRSHDPSRRYPRGKPLQRPKAPFTLLGVSAFSETAAESLRPSAD